MNKRSRKKKASASSSLSSEGLGSPNTAGSDENKLGLLTDLALGENSGRRIDGLGFETYDDVLKKVALGTSGPFTIGIFGEWGTGKTSLMRLIREKLLPKEEVVVVWFNAWMYEKEEHPIVPLIATIIGELDRKKSFFDCVPSGGKKLVDALRAVAYGFSSKSKIKIPGFAELEASFVAKDMVDREESLHKDPLLSRSLYFESFEQLSSVTLAKNQKVIVFIDDLDRCFPDQAINLLESIKLVLCQQGFIYFIGVSRKVIEGYLDHRYHHEYGIDGIEGQKYLDKIVQLAFHIPPHNNRIQEYCSSLLKQLKPTDRESLEPALSLIEIACEQNPRSVVRFINNLILDKEISEALSFRIPISFFAVTRSLQQRWGNIFLILASSKEVCAQIGLVMSDSTGGKPALEGDSKGIFAALQNDSDLKSILEGNEGRRWLTDHDNRLAAIEFLATQRDQGKQNVKLRLYELAMRLGVDNKELINYARSLGIDVKSHLSLIESEDVDQIIHYYGSEINISDLYDGKVATGIIRRRRKTQSDDLEL